MIYNCFIHIQETEAFDIAAIGNLDFEETLKKKTICL
jgi:hypothetical protein